MWVEEQRSSTRDIKLSVTSHESVVLLTYRIKRNVNPGTAKRENLTRDHSCQWRHMSQLFSLNNRIRGLWIQEQQNGRTQHMTQLSVTSHESALLRGMWIQEQHNGRTQHVITAVSDVTWVSCSQRNVNPGTPKLENATRDHRCQWRHMSQLFLLMLG